MQTQRQSVTGTRSIIATLDEARAATQQVAFAARRLLTMYTQDIEPAVYDQPRPGKKFKRSWKIPKRRRT